MSTKFEVRDGVQNPYYCSKTTLRPPLFPCSPLPGHSFWSALLTNGFHYCIAMPLLMVRLLLLALGLIIYSVYLLAIGDPLSKYIVSLREKRAMASASIAPVDGASKGKGQKEIQRRKEWDVYFWLVRLPVMIMGQWAFFCFGIKCEKEGLEKIQALFNAGAPFLFVCNHVNYLDVLLVAASIGPYAAVATKGIASIPIVGHICTAWGALYVNRTKHSNVTEQLKVRAQRVSSRKCITPVLIFPEGTTSTGEQVCQFKTGAFRLGVPVVPMLLTYDFGSISPGWTLPLGTFEHMARVPSKWGTTSKLTVLDKVEPGGMDEIAFAKAVQAKIAEAGGMSIAQSWGVKDSLELNKEFLEEEKKKSLKKS